MKSDLDLLVELYEAEKLALENLIQENLKDGENLSVYCHSEALLAVNQQLFRFKNFKGPLYEEINMLERMIDTANSLDQDFLKRIWNRRVEEQEVKVKLLREQPNKWFNDDQKIDDALFDLYERKIKIFKLYLNKEEKFCLKFSLSERNILAISILLKDLQRYESNFEYEDSEPNPLFLFNGLGFKLNDKNDSISYSYDMKSFKDASHLKTILAHWFFDIFRYFETGSAYLVIG